MKFDDQYDSFETKEDRDTYAAILTPAKPESLGFCPKIGEACRIDCIAYSKSSIFTDFRPAPCHGKVTYAAWIDANTCAYVKMFCATTVHTVI